MVPVECHNSTTFSQCHNLATQLPKTVFTQWVMPASQCMASNYMCNVKTIINLFSSKELINIHLF